MSGGLGLLLHLSGHMQAWGSPAPLKIRPTELHPTRAALIGLIGNCEGRLRSDDMSDLARLSFTIRIDRPGQRMADFHTIGGGYPRHLTPLTADGGRKKLGEGTILTERWYMTDAAYTVAVTGPTSITEKAAAALARPARAPYLGRRSCPPDLPVLIATHTDPVGLLDQMPLHRTAGGPVAFVHDTAPDDQPPDAELLDQPDGLRAWRPHPRWFRTRSITAPDGGTGTTYLNVLALWRDQL